MKVEYKRRYGTGTILHPTFRAHDVVNTIQCAKATLCGNVFQLYNYGGYTICAIAKEDVIKIEY